MQKNNRKKLMDVAAGRTAADVVLKNCRIIDVYNGRITEGDIAFCGDRIAGIGSYHGEREVDAGGAFAAPGFIDGHIHIESSYVTPEELSRLCVPHGTSTIIADPHEIVNVCGLDALDYMMEAAEYAAMDIRFMVPSCVPCTSFEHAGAVVDAADMKEPLKRDRILGLGEFMDFPGVVQAEDEILDKLQQADNCGKLIDGHSPGLDGNDLNAYAAAGIHTDHECATVQDMQERISRGMYALLRQGSACHDLRNLLKGVTPYNSRRCVLCSDDRQPKTILEEGHLDAHLRICVEEGIDPITAVQMATINAAECFRLYDRGAVAPGLRADVVLLEDLKDFRVKQMWIAGRETARDGEYLPELKKAPVPECLSSSFHVKDFSADRLKLHLKSDLVHVIDIRQGGVVTGKGIAEIQRTADGDFLYDPKSPVAKIAVIERHQNTGNMAVALIRNYGIKEGAVALSVAHDSHNIIVVGVNNEDMAFAVETLISQKGGIVLVKDGKVVESMPMVIGGIMSDGSGEWVREKLEKIHEAAFRELGISEGVEPVMTLCFMSLPVIPELKITDMGLFDVTKFEFIPLEASL